MDSGKERLTCVQAREADIVDYFSRLGIEPVQIKGRNVWYYSPFREEATPSFKIDRVKNCWFDHGEGKGGNLIDFAIRYHQCTVGEFLHLLEGDASFHKPGLTVSKVHSAKEPAIRISRESALASPPLLDYLAERRIAIAIADQYCREVHFELNGKNYYAIGFKNDSDGLELRNAWYKGSSSPKDFTSIRYGQEQISVFEGFFDFLTYLTLLQHSEVSLNDCLILNSLSFFEKARPLMESYQEVHLFLDNNTAGQNFRTYALSLSPVYMDESKLYTGYEDLNDFICGKRHVQKNHQAIQKISRTKSEPP